jgi:3-phenylpropionate/trans-cinnamate dioxygenase ferredoxin reductase subunit
VTSDKEHLIVVGGGEAGGHAAAHARAIGYGGALTVISGEGLYPYERPALSKRLLTDAEPVLPLHAPASSFTERCIDFEFSRAIALARRTRTVVLEGGKQLTYSKLLLCLGAEPVRMEVPGARLPGVLTLRDASQSLDLRKRLTFGRRVVVIGGGFIGLEVAASVRQRGCEVTVIEMADRLMARALPATVSATFEAVHREHGVDVRLGVRPVAVHGSERVAGVELSDGEIIPSEIVVVGIGVRPRDELARRAGLATGDGILVDRTGRTSDPHIFAAGDAVCQQNDWAGRIVRLEHWQSARDQAALAIEAMLGRDPSGLRPPWMWSDQYDQNLQIVGFPDLTGTFIIRGDPSSRSYALLQMRDDHLAAAITLNRPHDMSALRKIIAARGKVTAAVLADENSRLKSLLAAAAS